MSEKKITKAERDTLIRLAKARARQAKAEAERREAVLLAEVEAEMSAEFHARDELWADAVALAEEYVAKANAQIVARCADLGIPAKDAPRVEVGFMRLRYGERDERTAARKLATVRLAALTKSAKVEIDSRALAIETELIAGGLESADARAFAETMPTPEQLMPALTLDDIGVKSWQPPAGAANELMAPLTMADRKRRAVLRAIEANPGASNRKIAQIAGVDHKTVARYRPTGELPTGSGEVPTKEGES